MSTWQVWGWGREGERKREGKKEREEERKEGGREEMGSGDESQLPSPVPGILSDPLFCTIMTFLWGGGYLLQSIGTLIPLE